MKVLDERDFLDNVYTRTRDANDMLEVDLRKLRQDVLDFVDMICGTNDLPLEQKLSQAKDMFK